MTKKILFIIVSSQINVISSDTGLA